MTEIKNSFSQLFKSRRHLRQETILELYEVIAQDRDPMLEARLSLKILKNEKNERLTAVVSELSFLGENTLFSGPVVEKKLSSTGNSRRRVFQGAKISITVDEMNSNIKLSYNRQRRDFTVKTPVSLAATSISALSELARVF